MPRRRLRSIGEKGPVEQVEVLPAVREPGERVPVIEEVEVFEPRWWPTAAPSPIAQPVSMERRLLRAAKQAPIPSHRRG